MRRVLGDRVYVRGLRRHHWVAAHRDERRCTRCGVVEVTQRGHPTTTRWTWPDGTTEMRICRGRVAQCPGV